MKSLAVAYQSAFLRESWAIVRNLTGCSLSHTSHDSQEEVFAVGLDDERVLAVTESRFEEYVAELGLQSWMQVNLWLLDDDDLVLTSIGMHIRERSRLNQILR